MTGKRRWLASPVVVAPLLAAALWVNWPTLHRLLVRPAPAAELPPVFSPSKLPPSRGGSVPRFEPLPLDTVVADPFVHPAPGPEAPAIPPSAAVSTAAPEVSLVLCGSGGRRAVVDGRVVGIGDILPAGVVVDVVPAGIRLRTAASTEVLVPLRKTGGGATSASGASAARQGDRR
jgi:hypothetical protein